MTKNPKRINSNLLIVLGAIIGLGFTLSAFEYKDYYVMTVEDVIFTPTTKEDEDIYEVSIKKETSGGNKTENFVKPITDDFELVDDIEPNDDSFLLTENVGDGEGPEVEDSTLDGQGGGPVDEEPTIFPASMPRFKACKNIKDEDEARKCFEDNMQLHVKRFLKYPDQARSLNVQGTVYVRFVIEKDGSVSSFLIERDIDFGCGSEVVRVLKLLPEFEPGTNGVKPVRVSYVMPVKFTLGN